jgi:hypothetical protein
MVNRQAPTTVSVLMNVSALSTKRKHSRSLRSCEGQVAAQGNAPLVSRDAEGRLDAVAGSLDFGDGSFPVISGDKSRSSD